MSRAAPRLKTAWLMIAMMRALGLPRLDELSADAEFMR